MTPETPPPETDAEYKEAQDFERSALVEPLDKFLKLERELAAMTALADRLAEALEKADCGPDCTTIYYPEKPCDCGRLEALAAYQATKP